ncbi:hypothetical protein [Marinomonas rhodophyticola]|uniref:Tripartite tricarboxylate transporter family receptor n=1 Tax=Marinomonas rhodophyticola TaxID=2992803 RepID=A0ABT3KCP5_9GAMM|nr:hypothetical protein [Marinomonas sp. KJ51-3]MCW4628316.1 hypothetical protein [Marinomonas sp. KJ51-3]
MKKLSKLLGVSILSLGCLLSIPAKAQETELPSTINWTIPFGVGGGTDVWSSLCCAASNKKFTG